MSKEKWEKIILSTSFGDEKWFFEISVIKPVLPFKANGEICHIGWDIPTSWAIDSANQCWADEGHGKSLRPRPVSYLVNLVETENDYRTHCRIAETLGEEKPWPMWAKEAQKAGWTPPKGWKP